MLHDRVRMRVTHDDRTTIFNRASALGGNTNTGVVICDRNGRFRSVRLYVHISLARYSVRRGWV